MARLDGYQSTKSMAKHKDRPNPKRTTSGEENDAEPPNGIPVERPEPNSISVGREITGKQPYKREGTNDQRLERSSRIPGLRFPRLKSATTDSNMVVTASAIRAGCEKKAASPPQPRTARPRQASVPIKVRATLDMTVMGFTEVVADFLTR
jgi:hypothetical protein